MSAPSALKRFLPLIIIAAAIAIIFVVIASKPKAEKRPQQRQANISVSITQVLPINYAPVVTSFGSVEPRVQSKLVAQVSGRVEYVADKFRDGGTFSKGDLLIQLEKADYEIEFAIADANLLDTERVLEEEQARVEQAKEDWRRLGKSGEPAPLVLREPQLKAAQASLKAAQARVQAAQLALDRTEIFAPYDGRVISLAVDLGQVVMANTLLADIFATDAAEIRLPIKNRDLRYITLPEQSPNEPLYADIISDLGETETWQATLVRSSAAVDEASRQLYVVARLNAPFNSIPGEGRGQNALRAGQYVTAKLKTKPIEQALLVPNSAIYQGAYVYVYRDEQVFRRDIVFNWQDERNAVIEQGLEPGEYVVTSPLGKVASGTSVNAVGAHAKKKSNREGSATEFGIEPGKKPGMQAGKKPGERAASKSAEGPAQ